MIGRKLAVTFTVAGAMAISAGAAFSQGSTPAADPTATYRANCAACHGADLSGPTGPGIGSPLKGPAFIAKWGKVAPSDFAAYVHKTMPLNAPGSLDEATALASANFVLAANGLAIAADAMPTPTSNVAMALPVKDEDRDAGYRAAVARRAAVVDRLSPVGDDDLSRPAASNWSGWRGSSASQGYSTLKQIDRSNVAQLGLAWSLSLESGTNAIAPVVHEGVMFLNSQGTVRALDARSGEELWQYARPATALRSPAGQPRGIAIWGDAVFVPTVDNHVLAFEAKTGKLRWDHEIGQPSDLLQLIAAPIAVHGKIIQGVAGCAGVSPTEAGGGCYIVALDAETGKEAWRFHTIARPGEPGGDSWNGAPWEKRLGGSVWGAGSYDADLNLVYFGIGQTYAISTLLDRQPRKGASTDALYTNATIALDPDTGKLVWYYQHVQGDVWDLDWAFERTIATQPGSSRKLVITGGKLGIFDALDAKTGRYLWSYDLGLQNLVTAIDPKTGRKTFDKALYPEYGKPKRICPSTVGNRNWMSTAYDPGSGVLFIPITPTCMDFARNDIAKDQTSLENYGQMSVKMRQLPNGDGNHGWIAALDIASRKPVWTNKRRAPSSSATMVTAGGLLFEGGRDRTFRALDATDGKTLWQTRLPALPNAFPLTYMIDGVQYVAIVTGGGTVVDAYHSTLEPEAPPLSANKTIMVFALPEQAGAAAD